MKLLNRDAKEKNVENSKDANLKNAVKDLYHMLDAIEFAEAHKDEKLKAAYEKEAIALLRSIKHTYKEKIFKMI